MTKKQALKLVEENRKDQHHEDNYSAMRNVLISPDDFESWFPFGHLNTDRDIALEIGDILESLAYSYNGDIA